MSSQKFPVNYQDCEWSRLFRPRQCFDPVTPQDAAPASREGLLPESLREADVSNKDLPGPSTGTGLLKDNVSVSTTADLSSKPTTPNSALPQPRRKPTLLFVKPGADNKRNSDPQIIPPIEIPKQRFFSSSKHPKLGSLVINPKAKTANPSSSTSVIEASVVSESDIKEETKEAPTVQDREGSTSAENNRSENPFLFESCYKFKFEGFCPEGQNCAFLHVERGAKYQKATAKLLLKLTEKIETSEDADLRKLLGATEKFDKYLRVYKRTVYRHDKNEMFPAF